MSAFAEGTEAVVNSWEAEAEPRAAGTSYLVTSSFDAVSGLARDKRMVTMHFTDLTGNESLQTLCANVATNWGTYFGTSAHKVTVTAYLSDFAVAGTPHPPLAQATNGASAVIPRAPGEISLCLSYFSTFNIKRNRGRIFIPFDFLWAHEVSPAAPGERPSATNQQSVMDVWELVIKPVDHNTNWDWVVKSRADKQHKPITDLWVDNEWDTIRARGLRGDQRITGKT